MEDQITDNNRTISEIIIKEVTEFFQVDPEELKSIDRHRPLVKARQIIFFLMIHNTTLTLKRIGSTLNRDHSTVLHSKDTVEDLLKTDRFYKKDFEAMKASVKDQIDLIKNSLVFSCN